MTKEEKTAYSWVMQLRLSSPSFPQIHDDNLRNKLLWLLGDIADKCDAVMDQIRKGEI